MNFVLPVPSKNELKEFQLQHYAERLSKAVTTKEKRFLRSELFNLKKIKNVQNNCVSVVGLDRGFSLNHSLHLLPEGGYRACGEGIFGSRITKNNKSTASRGFKQVYY